MAATSESVGVFWGPAGRPPPAVSAQLRRQNSGVNRSSSTLRLPQLAQSLPPLPRENAASSLLEVLHTLLRSITSDMNTFMKGMRVMDPPADKTTGPRYYSPAVAVEDQEFFVRERESDADREAALAATTVARERHCAVLDKQNYSFDRRKQRSKSISSRPNLKDAANAETTRIERHRRKIEHLLHVLQDEIAKETRREIEFLDYSGPHGPRSKQSRRQMALIIKARYEAADRIMRILEEYRIVVGVPAADYLLETIADGKALLTS